jgi:metal-sulfur cluster biosynthetic enzyme
VERAKELMTNRCALVAEIARRLEEVPEPCAIAMGLSKSIVDMGLIEDIAIDDEGCVTITLCLTDAGCVHFNSMRRYIADVLDPVEGIDEVHVKQTLDKLWSPDRERA